MGYAKLAVDLQAEWFNEENENLKSRRAKTELKASEAEDCIKGLQNQLRATRRRPERWEALYSKTEENARSQFLSAYEVIPVQFSEEDPHSSYLVVSTKESMAQIYTLHWRVYWHFYVGRGRYSQRKGLRVGKKERPFTFTATQTPRLTDTSESRIAFKIKTTVREQYRVQRNRGYVNAGSEVKIEIRLQSQVMNTDTQQDAERRDRFTVEYFAILPKEDSGISADSWENSTQMAQSPAKKKESMWFSPTIKQRESIHEISSLSSC